MSSIFEISICLYIPNEIFSQHNIVLFTAIVQTVFFIYTKEYRLLFMFGNRFLGNQILNSVIFHKLSVTVV